MKSTWFSKAALFVSGLFWASVALQPATARAEDDLVARVGMVPITRPEVEREMHKILPTQVRFHGGVNEERLQALRDKAMEALIERAYMVQSALQEKIRVDEREVDELYDKVRDGFKSEKDFKKALEKETPAALRGAILRELLAKKTRETVVEAKVGLSEVEVLSYYESHKDKLWQPKRFRASHIQINVDPVATKEKKEELKIRAEELAVKARAGEDFYNLAYYNSDDRTRFVGGDLGLLPQGRLIKVLEEPLLAMKPGEVAGPVRTEYGYHILKLMEVEEARQFSFEEARESIRKHLENEKRETLYSAWMEGLKQKYPVQRFDAAD